MARVCECTGKRPLALYLEFLDEFARNEMESDSAECKCGDSATAIADSGNDLQTPWTASDPRRLLLLRALHGAQEAADAEQASFSSICFKVERLVKVRE